MKIVITFVNEYDEERTEKLAQIAKNSGFNFVNFLLEGAVSFANEIKREYACIDGETFTYNIKVIE